MAERTIEERIAELQKRQSQLKEQEKALKAKQSQALRKARTKRLIEIGAVVESVIGKPIEHNDLPKLQSYLIKLKETGHGFDDNTNRPPIENNMQDEQHNTQFQQN